MLAILPKFIENHKTSIRMMKNIKKCDSVIHQLSGKYSIPACACELHDASAKPVIVFTQSHRSVKEVPSTNADVPYFYHVLRKLIDEVKTLRGGRITIECGNPRDEAFYYEYAQLLADLGGSGVQRWASPNRAVSPLHYPVGDVIMQDPARWLPHLNN